MTETAGNKKQIIHIIITIVLMFGIGLLPPVSQLTESGMKTLGILLGTVWGITFCQVAWPCLLGLAALFIYQVAPIGTIFSTGMGNDSVMTMIFFFMVAAVLEENGIVQFLSAWLLSRKIIKGRPWLFSYFIIAGTMLVAATGVGFATLIIFFGILIDICNLYGVKPYTKYPTVMFMGICIGGLAASSFWLFVGNPLFVNSMLIAISGGAVALNFGLYALFSFAIWLILAAAYVLVCKYLLKIDLGAMANIDDSVVNKAHLILNKRQKVTLAYLVLLLVIYCGKGFVPASSSLGQYLGFFGATGPLLIILALMAITQVDGQAIANIPDAARKGVAWDTVFLSGALLSIATIMMTTDTGVDRSILALLGPIFEGKGTVFMCVIICVISIILTNFMANTTVGLMFTPVIFSFSQTMGFEPLPMIAMLLISITIAYVTPAASPFAAILFGYSNWVRPADIYKYGVITCIFMVIVLLVVGIPLSNILM